MYAQGQDGLMNTYRSPWRNRTPRTYALSATIIGFYCLLYFTDVLEPVAQAVKLQNKWYLYGALYCVFMTIGGIYMLRTHGNSRYHKLRITVNILVQIVLGFTLPFVMPFFGGKEFYWSYFWPLKYDYFFPDTLWGLPWYMALYTLLGSLVLTPVLALAFGKRWYCSWVCGCGALANTFGDPWRHMTSSSTASWRFEKYSIHAVLLFILGLTGIMLVDGFGGKQIGWFHELAGQTKWVYGFFVGSVLSGVIGTGVYPVLGPRIWCRNFCPMAAILGITQKAGRFRIAVKPDMCISCGNCTTYCEMGIDVRAYAQQNESFTRASCVGCGMCAHVCPRGVLKLENGALELNTDKAASGQLSIDF
ncbi:MAG: 4Fe-4S binding protein [Deltaproteobacteria bacterium]|nr:MAG: 4Fe-4S binding protein [Deltaproteobacteria bacterium]